MFLKVFKEKSNQKFVEKALLKRNVNVHNNKITSVGVLLNDSEYCNYDEINSFLDTIGVASNQRKFMTFSKLKENVNNWDTVFTTKDFGWSGKIKNSDLSDFTKAKFDVLICYFLAEDQQLKQIAAMSMANFKVGISNKDVQLYDLIIDVNNIDFNVFKNELKKYLTILNKI